MKNIVLFLLILIGCTEKQSTDNAIIQEKQVAKPLLNLQEANRLAQLPLHCVQVEYPNKLGQVLGDSTNLQSPKSLHPAFYGCFDWHSAVHGHWSLVKLLKQFPNIDNKKDIETKLLQNISKDNILKEVDYFKQKYNGSFERTYGWAWLLKLAEELHTWDAPIARTLETNLQPLTSFIANQYIAFLPKLNYPIRVGEHTNTAFGLTFAYDFALTTNHITLKETIESKAKDFYLNDVNCPINWEPSGFDFLSPCLEEAAIMKRILPKNEFKTWIDNFLPDLIQPNFNMEVGKVSDRKDGKLVHLDGVNFSRAWSLNTIAKDMPEYAHLKQLANKHINYSLPSIVDNNYEGGHWLGSFAIYALNTVTHD